MATRPRLVLASVNALLLMLLLPSGWRAWAGSPPPASTQPAALDLAQVAVPERDLQASGLDRMRPAWEQLDPRPPAPQAAASEERAAPPRRPQGQLLAISAESCIVQDAQGHQHAVAVGDAWGDYQVAAIRLQRGDQGVVGTLELQRQDHRDTLELVRD
jgi:hypothetical protein